VLEVELFEVLLEALLDVLAGLDAGALFEVFDEVLDAAPVDTALAAEPSLPLPLAASDAAEPLPAAASAAVLPTAASLVLLVPPALFRKSVTYHPEPLSWKPAAVTCFS
jgi:hypothetical protein